MYLRGSRLARSATLAAVSGYKHRPSGSSFRGRKGWHHVHDFSLLTIPSATRRLCEPCRRVCAHDRWLQQRGGGNAFGRSPWSRGRCRDRQFLRIRRDRRGRWRSRRCARRWCHRRPERPSGLAGVLPRPPHVVGLSARQLVIAAHPEASDRTSSSALRTCAPARSGAL